MPALLAFTGFHNAGKTSVACNVIPILISKGYRVAVIKSTSHDGIERNMDPNGTDTSRYRKTGAEAAAILYSQSLTLFQDHNGLPAPELAQRLFYDFDVVIMEGFKNAKNIPKIEILHHETPEKPLYSSISGIEAVVANSRPEDLPATIIFFHRDDADSIADFIEERYVHPAIRSSFRLHVNGKRIDTTRFVASALSGTVAGFINSLRGTENARQIDISFRLPSADRLRQKG